MTQWIFETPWWLPTLIAMAGVVVFFVGNQRGEGRVRMAGLGGVVAAVALGLVSYFVNTPRERAVEQTRTLVRAFEARDWATFEKVLPARVSLGLLNYPKSIYSNKAELVAGAKRAQESYNFKGIHITSLTAEQTGTLITVTLEILSEQDLTMGRPIPSAWQFDFQETAEGWWLQRVTTLRIANQAVDQVLRTFPR